MALKNKLVKRLVNIPIILNLGQNFLGANRFKSEIYQSVFAKEASGTFLDFGCSYGNTTAGFLRFDYYGVDIDCDAIEAAKRRYAGFPQVIFFCVNILQQEFKNDFFDHILFASTSHHLSDDELRQILDRLLKFLKAGGELHFFDIFRQPGKDKFITRLLTRFDQGKYIRTLREYDNFFASGQYRIAERKIFQSPKRLLRLWDFVYIKLLKPR